MQKGFTLKVGNLIFLALREGKLSVYNFYRKIIIPLGSVFVE